MDFTQAKISEIAASVRNKKVSAVEVTKHFLDRIEKLDKQLNAFITINTKAIEETRKVDAIVASGKDPGLLAGAPIAVKDLLCTEGLKTTAASKILADFIPPYDSTVVAKMRAQGAIVIGKTNLDEFAMGSSNETSVYGNVKNPWNPEYVPGGSSGGSAAALAAHLSPGAIGTDTGGSIRQPANFCGVYGLKPTYGRVSRYGIVAYASSLDQAGPMAHSTEDCALMLESFAGFCKHDSTTTSEETPKWSKNLKDDLSGMRIGLPKEYFAAERACCRMLS